MQTENPLQNAYIGEYGETWSYSYTFKWKTAVEIWNEWTAQVWTIATNSEWLTWTSGSDVIVTKSIPSLTNAKRITVSWTIVWQNIENTAGMTGVNKGSWWGTWDVGYAVYWSQFGGMRVANYYNWTSYEWNVVWNATGLTYTSTLTIDLEAKTIVWAVSWFSNSTLTLTDAQITDIRTYEYLRCYVSTIYSTISSVGIIVEY